MPIVQVGADGGTSSVREDYPWRGISLADTSLTWNHDATGETWTATEVIERWQNQGIVINPASCVMGGLDVTAKIPVCGLGVPFLLSELDFVWLAVYFDSNLRPIHAGIQKGARFSRWYEYGGISMAGFPRSIKTVRRDHIGVDIGAEDSDGYIRPDVKGPEYDYIAHELEKEVELLSPYGFLDLAGSTLAEPIGGPGTAAPFELKGHGGRFKKPKAGVFDKFKRAIQSELTYFMQDPTQVKQFAAYSLLGYCTSSPPAKDYPYPNVKLKKKFVNGAGQDTELVYYYRQVTKEHLMLQEINAGGVRACHLVPSFAPYMEALPHPTLQRDDTFGAGTDFRVYSSDGVEGTLPPEIVDHADYIGSEMKKGELRAAIDSPNTKSTLPLPGENAVPSIAPMGVIGHYAPGWWYKNSLSPAGYSLDANKKRYEPGWLRGNWDIQLPGNPGGATWNGANVPGGQSFEFYLSKGSCLDSKVFKITSAADDPLQIQYIQEDGTPIDWFKMGAAPAPPAP